MRYRLPTILRGLVQANGSFIVPRGGQFRLTVQVAEAMNAGNAQRLAGHLPEAFNGRATVQISGATVIVAGTNGQTRSANDLKGEILSIVDNYGNIESASLEADLAQPDPVQSAPPPPRGVSTRDPIAPREEPRPVVEINPVTGEPEPVGSSSGNGNGSGNNGNGSTTDDQPLPLPAIVSNGKIFGIEPKYLLIGGVALFFLMGKK